MRLLWCCAGYQTGAKRVYVFVKPIGGWANPIETAAAAGIRPRANRVQGCDLGHSVVAGAFNANHEQGAAYVFQQQVAATITLTKSLVPASDPGRFDLKVAGTFVKSGAGTAAPAPNRSLQEHTASPKVPCRGRT